MFPADFADWRRKVFRYDYAEMFCVFFISVNLRETSYNPSFLAIAFGIALLFSMMQVVLYSTYDSDAYR